MPFYLSLDFIFVLSALILSANGQWTHSVPSAQLTVPTNLSATVMQAYLTWSSVTPFGELGFSLSQTDSNIFIGSKGFGIASWRGDIGYQFTRSEYADTVDSFQSADYVGDVARIKGSTDSTGVCVMVTGSTVVRTICAFKVQPNAWNETNMINSTVGTCLSHNGNILAIPGNGASMLIYSLSSNLIWSLNQTVTLDFDPSSVSVQPGKLYIGMIGLTQVNVYTMISGIYVLTGRLLGGIAGFGASIAVKGNVLAVGSPASSTVHVFRIGGTSVSTVCGLAHGTDLSKFGFSLAMDAESRGETMIIIGAPGTTANQVFAMRVNGQACRVTAMFQTSSLGQYARFADANSAVGYSVAYGSQIMSLSIPFMRSTVKDNAGVVGMTYFCFQHFYISNSKCTECPLGFTSGGGQAASCSQCPSKPLASTWTFACGYTCNQYYELSDCSFFNCTAKMGYVPRANSTWVATGTNCAEQCVSGYSMVNGVCTVCPNPKPTFGQYVPGSCNINCVANYFGQSCLPCGQYQAAISGSKPANSVWVDGVATCSWRAVGGYTTKVGPSGTVVVVPCNNSAPTNGQWDLYDCDFICNPTFFVSGSNCVLCSQSMSSTRLPSQFAYWVDGLATCDWACQTGYTKQSGICCSNLQPLNSAAMPGNLCGVSCDPGYTFNTYQAVCSACNVSLPGNSAFTTRDNCSYACNSGFFGAQCQLCSQYMASLGTVQLPYNASWIDYSSTCDWGCASPYVKYYDQCCPLSPPLNSVADPTATSTCGFRCNDMYEWVSATKSCRVCGDSPPPPTNSNSQWNKNKCRYVCNTGYFGSNCVSCSACAASTSCKASMSSVNWAIPTTAQWVDGDTSCYWACNTGYTGRGSTCCQNKPVNSSWLTNSATSSSCQWTCNTASGYFFDSAGGCSPCSDPSVIRSSSKPDNSSWVFSSSTWSCVWMCDSNFVAVSNSFCCPAAPLLQDGGNWEWTPNTQKLCVRRCMSGYTKTNGKCVLTDPCMAYSDCSSCRKVTSSGTQCSWCSDGCRTASLIDDSSCLSSGDNCDTVTCSSWNYDCDSCASLAACTFCATTGKCISVNSKNTCSLTVEKCSAACNYDNCNDCMDQKQCGWCATSNQCILPTSTTSTCAQGGLAGSCSGQGIWLVGIICGAVSSLVVGVMCCCFILRVRTHQRNMVNNPGFEMTMPPGGNLGGSLAAPAHEDSRGLPAIILATFPTFQYSPNFQVSASFERGMPSKVPTTNLGEDDTNAKPKSSSAEAASEEKKEEEEQPTCSICLGEFTEGEDIRMLPCLHLFHQACIDKWFNLSRECPLCKRNLMVNRAPPAATGAAASFTAAQMSIASSSVAAHGLPTATATIPIRPLVPRASPSLSTATPTPPRPSAPPRPLSTTTPTPPRPSAPPRAPPTRIPPLPASSEPSN